MKKLLTYLRDYKKECVLAPLFKLMEASFELIVPLVMAAIIDKGSAGFTGIDRSDMFHYRTVFCGEGGCRIFYQASVCIILAY